MAEEDVRNAGENLVIESIKKNLEKLVGNLENSKDSNITELQKYLKTHLKSLSNPNLIQETKKREITKLLDSVQEFTFNKEVIGEDKLKMDMLRISQVSKSALKDPENKGIQKSFIEAMNDLEKLKPQAKSKSIIGRTKKALMGKVKSVLKGAAGKSNLANKQESVVNSTTPPEFDRNSKPVIAPKVKPELPPKPQKLTAKELENEARKSTPIINENQNSGKVMNEKNLEKSKNKGGWNKS